MRVGFIIPDRSVAWDSIHQGIGYVSRYAEHIGALDEYEVHRTYGTDVSELRTFLDKKWDVIGLTLTDLHYVVEECAGAAKLAKEVNNSTVVVGGPGATTNREHVFEMIPGTDFVVCGEGEVTFAELIECLKNNGDVSQVNGLIYRDKDGKSHATLSRGLERDLSLFPPPDRSKFKYSYEFHSIIGTRGCPYKCTFCNSSANWEYLYRRRRPSDIVDEMRSVIDREGRDKYFAFNDDLLNIKRDWMIALANAIKDLNVRWWIRGVRADLITEEVADALAASQCMGGACGIESADNNALRAMKKGTTIEKLMKGVRIFQSRGMPLVGQFIIGNHGDTLETTIASIECAKEFSEATFGVAYPIKHTYLDEYVEKNNLRLPEPVPVQHRGKVVDWILFDTPEFPVADRLKAVELAIEAKFFHNIDYSQEQSTAHSCENDKDLIEVTDSTESSKAAKRIASGTLVAGERSQEPTNEPSSDGLIQLRRWVKGKKLRDWVKGSRSKIS